MPNRSRLQVRVQIPADVSPGFVIEALQSFNPLLDAHGCILDYDHKWGDISKEDLAVIQQDPYFHHYRDDMLENEPSSSASPVANGKAASKTLSTINSKWAFYKIYQDVFYVPILIPSNHGSRLILRCSKDTQRDLFPHGYGLQDGSARRIHHDVARDELAILPP
ncbi:hypothetical protein GGR57DRAFT_414559 [Xylariaceae sp. FL1272]|nr:hypothetical protein GGR57DRAFT_414559 [Xylariaceae sp. FL1272]